jgi:hypothetical protein
VHEAESLLLRRKAELHEGGVPVRVPEILTLDQLLDRYIAQIENPSTQKSRPPELMQAVSKLRELKIQIAAARVSQSVSEALTVNQLLDCYIAQIENPSTQKRYKLSQQVLSPLCGREHITDVNAFTFDRFKELRKKPGVSPAGVNRDIAL